MLYAVTEPEHPARARSVPAPVQRRCIASGDVLPVDRLVRFVVDPTGRVVPDVGRDLPGRGIWVTASRGCVDLACGKKLFGRAAKKRVTAADDLADQVEALLARRCLELIGLSRRAGAAVAGYDKVRGFIIGGRAGLLLAAADGAPSGRDKIRRLGRGVPVVEALSRAELGHAFGREQVVHAAIAAGQLAKKVQVEAARLAEFRRRIAE